MPLAVAGWAVGPQGKLTLPAIASAAGLVADWAVDPQGKLGRWLIGQIGPLAHTPSWAVCPKGMEAASELRAFVFTSRKR